MELVIWQHPSEQHHPKGTADLLRLCLTNSRLHCAEKASAEDLNVSRDKCALLYPSENEMPASDNRHNQRLPVRKGQSSSFNQLIVIDGTWRKSRKIIYLNPWLNDLPRYSIKDKLSQYCIRKAESSLQLSTFESAVNALARLEPQNEIEALEAVFIQYMEHIKKTHSAKTIW